MSIQSESAKASRAKMKEEKARAKIEADKAKKELDEKRRKVREAMKREEEMKKARKKEAAQKNKNFLSFIKESIIVPYKKIKDDILLDDNMYIEKLEDGNVIGKVGEVYFFSHQVAGKTQITTFKPSEVQEVNDGERYSSYVMADTYIYNSVGLDVFDNPQKSTLVIDKKILSHKYHNGHFNETQDYQWLESKQNQIDSRIKELEQKKSR